MSVDTFWVGFLKLTFTFFPGHDRSTIRILENIYFVSSLGIVDCCQKTKLIYGNEGLAESVGKISTAFVTAVLKGAFGILWGFLKIFAGFKIFEYHSCDLF